MPTVKRNIPIQILRVISCLMVFVVHFGQRCELTGIVRSFTDFGKYGVYMFFLISGYLAAASFANNTGADIKKYYFKRAIAILPLYYISVIYFFVSENIISKLTSVSPPIDEFGLGWFRYLFLLNGVVPAKETFWSNLGMTWTIPIFAFFYLIAPWILKRIKGIWGAFAAWIGILVMSEIIKLFYSCTIASNLHYFFLGSVIFWCVNKKVYNQASVIFLIGALAAIIANVKFISYTFIFAAIILVFVNCDTIVLPQRIQSILNVVDKYSYTLYLVQGIVFVGIVDKLKLYNNLPLLAVAAISVFATAFLTFVIGKFIEKPLQNLLTRKLT